MNAKVRQMAGMSEDISNCRITPRTIWSCSSSVRRTLSSPVYGSLNVRSMTGHEFASNVNVLNARLVRDRSHRNGKWFRLAQWNDVPLSIVLVFVTHDAWSRSAEENAMLRRQLLTLSSSPVRQMG